ncbi:MAG: hypothetical protein ACLPWD_01590 [Methanobacterium sp.]
MRKVGPPKLDKSDSNNSKFNFDNIKDKTNLIKDKDSSRPPKLDKSDFNNSKFNFDNIKDNSSLIKDKDSSRPPKLDKSEDLQDKFANIDKRIILGAIGLIIIIIAAVLIAGVDSHKTIIPNKTNNTTNPVTADQNLYNNGIISFYYPQGWSVLNQQVQAPLIVTVQQDPNNSLSIFSENLGNTSFTEFVLQWRQSILQNGEITYEGNVTMSGVNGYDIEATYNNTTTNTNTIYNTRGIAIDKNDTAYIIIFTFNTTLLNYSNQMNQVISSFQVKQ